MAGLIKLLDEGTIDRNDKVLVPITGSGLKDIGILEKEAKGVQEIDPLPDELEKIFG